MKFVTTIDNKDYTLVVTREDDKVDGEYIMYGNLFVKKSHTTPVLETRYPETLTQGIDNLTEFANDRVRKLRTLGAL